MIKNILRNTMAQRLYLGIAIGAVILIIVLAMAYNSNPQTALAEKLDLTRTDTETRGEDPKVSEMLILAQTLVQQRNEIAVELNLKQQKLGQIACEKLGKTRVATSETGGWCKSSSKENGGEHVTDKDLANALADFFKGKSVASFGDGPGRYKQILVDSRKVKGYDAYDGAPYCDTTSEGRVKFLDLTLKQFGLPLYDWVMSLEVAEHIPGKYESFYVDNIIRHAREGIIISWAVPGQGGYSHVNNRPFTYVAELMDKHGFTHDKETSTQLKNVSKLPWLRNNVNVFRRRDVTQIDKEAPFFT